MQLQRFAQVLKGFLFCSTLARHIDFQALRHVQIFLPPYARGERLFHVRHPSVFHCAASFNHLAESESALFVLDGLDDVLACCGACRQEAGEDPDKEAGE